MFSRRRSCAGVVTAGAHSGDNRSRGRWRGGRPRIPREVRGLIAQMARENFLWGAPRIHGELLMLGFKVSQATVSRYMPRSDRRPGQSWKSFLRLQAVAFGKRQNLEQASDSEHSAPWNRPAGNSESALLARSGAVHRRSWSSRDNQSPAQVRMPTPPYPARASPRLASRALRCSADQVLRRHTGSEMPGSGKCSSRAARFIRWDIVSRS